MTNNWYTIEFYSGAISPQTIADLLNSKIDVISGASNIFLGRVRADEIQGKKVNAIEYTAHEEMAKAAFATIIEETKNSFAVNSVHLIHSMGVVKKGELCLVVVVDCGHRKESFQACEYIVERLKKEVPIWGKEIFEDESHQWKTNN